MDILYHYCSTASFHAITQSHSLWLSALSLSNDSMEGKLVASAIARLAENDSLDQHSIRRLQDSIGILEQIIEGLGFCLSEDGDLLSQWRGYASDATGVSIGFSTEYLKWLSEISIGRNEPGFTLQQIVYEPSDHETHVQPTYLQVKQLIDAGAFKIPIRGILDTRTDEEIGANWKAYSQLSMTLLLLFSELFRLKAPAFREEREWRLLSYLVNSGYDSSLYRAVHDRIVPYRPVTLLGLERAPIREVILGPKHNTPPKVVENFLNQNQYGVVRVKRSQASYR